MGIEFKGMLDRRSLTRAVALANKPSKKMLALRIGMLILFGGLFGAYVVSILQKPETTLLEHIRIERHAITLLFLVVILIQPYWSAARTAKKIWATLPQGGYISGQINESAIQYGSRTIAWADFSKLRLREDLLVLVTAGGVMLYLTPALFQTPGDWNKAVSLAKFKAVEPL